MIINLTPHSIHLHLTPTHSITIHSSGLARAVESATVADPIEHTLGGEVYAVPTCRNSYEGTEGLPAPVVGTWLVVSAITADAAARSGRSTDDLLVPGEQVRDASGRIVGCRSLARVAAAPVADPWASLHTEFDRVRALRGSAVDRSVTDPLLVAVCQAASGLEQRRARAEGHIDADVRRRGHNAEAVVRYHFQYGQAPDLDLAERMTLHLGYLIRELSTVETLCGFCGVPRSGDDHRDVCRP